MIDATRRDYLVAKALAYAIAAIETLPEYQRTFSDQQDMMTLFASRPRLHPKKT